MKRLLTAGMTLSLTALLAACGPSGGETPNPDNSFDVQRIVGTVDTKFKLGSVAIHSTATPFLAESATTGSNNINFNLSLVAPKAVDLTGNFTVGCEGQNSNPAAKLFTVPQLHTYSSEGDLVGYTTESALSGTGVTAGSSSVVRIFADSAVSFAGTCTSTNDKGQPVSDTLNVNLKQGWNALLVTPITGGLNIVTAPPDIKVGLKFTQAAQYVSAVFKPSTLTFTDNNPITVDAAFSRVGGYTGTVSLSTDVPGLTVSPSTVNLPALATLGLSTQSLKTKMSFSYTGPGTQFNKPFNLIVKDASGKTQDTAAGTLVVNRPGVMLSFGSQMSVNVFQGESANVSVDVMASANFAGQTSVSLTGLPAGLSAPTATVTVQNNGSATAAIPLAAGATAPIGTYTIGVTSPDSGGNTGASTFTVNVLAKRTAIGQGMVPSLALAPNGDLWGAQGQQLVQIQGEKVAATVALSGSADRVQVGPNGAVWARGSSNFFQVTGSTAKAFAANGMPANPTQSFGVDSQGRVWYMSFNGFNAPSLTRLDPATGTQTVIPTVKSTNTSVPVMNDGTGKYVVFGATDGSIVVVDTATGQNQASAPVIFPAMESVRFITLDRAGNLWIASSGPRALLLKFNPQTLTVEKQADITNLTNSDGGYKQLVVEDATTAWFLKDQSMAQLNLTTNQVTTTALPNIGFLHAVGLKPQSGVAYTFGPQSNAAEPAQSEYLRFLP